jgi:WD40 repeat protein
VNSPQRNNPPYIQPPQSQTAPLDNNRTQPTTKGGVIAQAPSGKVTAQVESNQSTIIIRDTAGNTLAELQNNGSTVDDVKFSPDGAMMAVSSLDNTIKIWAIDGRLIREVKNSYKVTSFDFSSDSRSLIYSLDGRADSITIKLE